MGLQLIFVVETNRKCMSDWIYLKDTIERFYQYDEFHTKFSVVYMNGKGNYKAKEKEIANLISQYASTKGNQSRVIYCFDCDDYDRSQGDADFLKMAREYCSSRGYDFVWFCKDIESVYLGRKVDDKQKKKESASFKAKKLISGVNVNALSEKRYRINSSNLLLVLDNYLSRK